MVERFYRGILDSNATIDELQNALGTSGYTGTINDRISAYGTAGGYTGSINDKAARYAGGNAALAAIRLAMTTATEYAVAGDSTRDNLYNEGISYYTRMLGKAGITVIDNAASGQSGLDWVNDTDTPNKTTLIAAITGTGSGTIVEFSYGINDVDSNGDAIAGHGGTLDAAQIVANFKTGIDAVLTSKPDTTFVFVEPVTVASSARNTTLREIYTLLSAEYPQFYLVRMQDHMDTVYDNGTGNVFYYDGTHPNNIGTIRVINKILNEILDDTQLASVQLDNEHWNGSGENVITSYTNTDIDVGHFWSTSAATRSTNVNWACWPILEISNGQRVRTFHNGNRDEIVYSNSGTGVDNTGAVFLSTDTVPDEGALPNEYIHYVTDASATRAGLNIHSDGRATVGDEYLDVYEIIPGQSAGDLTQPEINVGLTPQRLVDPDNVGTANFDGLTTISMATATQDDLDITVGSQEMLEVFFEDVGLSAQTEFLFHDGTSFRTGATDYRRGWINSAATTTLGDHTSALDIGAGSNVYGHYRFTGFNNANASPMMIGSDPARVARATGNFVSATQVRLGTLADYDGVGTIRWRKFSVPTLAAFTSLDFSAVTTGTIAGSIDVDGFDEVWADLDQVTGGTTRLAWRFSEDGATFNSATEYNIAAAHLTNTSALQNFWNVSLDNTALKDASPLNVRGMSGFEGWPGLDAIGFGTYGYSFGSYETEAPITHIGPHEWDDGTGYTAGIASGVVMGWGSKSGSVDAVAGSSSSIVFSVDGYDNAELTFAKGFAISAASENLQMEFSIDGGSTYESTSYWHHQALSSFTEGASSIVVGQVNSTANVATMLLYGLGSGMQPHLERGCGPVAAVRGGSGGWQGGTDAITHIRLTLSNSATFNATNISLRKWNY